MIDRGYLTTLGRPRIPSNNNVTSFPQRNVADMNDMGRYNSSSSFLQMSFVFHSQAINSR